MHSTAHILYIRVWYGIYKYIQVWYQYVNGSEDTVLSMMSNIMNKTFSYAVDRFKSKYVGETVDLTAFFKASLTGTNNIEEIHKFLKQVKSCFNNASLFQQRQYLIVVVFCSQQCYSRDIQINECLAGFGPNVVAFVARASSPVDKRLGYLALTALVASCPDDFVYLAVNTVLKDISSKHSVIIKLALNVASHLVNVDLIPVLLPVVERRLSHTEASVKIKALITLHCMYQVAPEFILNTHNYMKVALSDHNPEVMAACLPYLLDAVKKGSTLPKNLSSKLIFILEQVVQGNMPISMSRHGISAPYVQIRILKILTLIEICDDSRSSLSSVLLEIMKRCQNIKQSIAFAVAYECIRTIVELFKPNHDLFKVVVNFLRKFLDSKLANHILAGLDLLTSLTSSGVVCTFQFQTEKLKILGHSDETIKKQALICFEAMMTQDNYKDHCPIMIEQLNCLKQPYFVERFSEKLAVAVEKFSESPNWLFSTLHAIIAAADDNVSMSVCNKLIYHIFRANTFEISDEVQRSCNLLAGRLSFSHYRTITQIIGRHFDLQKNTISDIVDLLIQQAESQDKTEKMHCEDRACVLLSSVKQLLCRNNSSVEEHSTIMQKVIKAVSPHLLLSPIILQRLIEMNALSNRKISKVLKQDINEYDLELSFLEVYVEEADTHTTEVASPPDQLKRQPYTFSSQPMAKTTSALMASLLPATLPVAMEESFLSKKVSEKQPQVWSKGGYKAPQTNAALNQALENLSAVANATEDDKTMMDIMYEMFQTSQTSSSDVTIGDLNEPCHSREKEN